ncbi:Hypothetical predicted protein, partial [Marmota monax]
PYALPPPPRSVLRSLSSSSTFRAVASLPCPSHPAAAARIHAPCGFLAQRPALPERASRTDARSFPLARRGFGSGCGWRTARGSTVAAAAGWRAGHGGGWGRRTDETATHPGNKQGEGAAGFGAPRRGQGAERGRQRRGCGKRR